MQEKLTYKEVQKDIENLAGIIEGKKYTSLYPVKRGGVPVALMLSPYLDLPIVDELEPSSLVVDDLVDSGKTIEKYPDNDIATLYIKEHSPKPTYYNGVYATGVWVEFPWEQDKKIDAEDNFRRILEFLGEDPTREGLVETPKRYVKFMQEFLKKEDFNFTSFTNEDSGDEMIIQKDIPFFSLCEHHTAPFFGFATVAYIPDGRIVGLSKLARTVQYYAHNFQNQERITSQVAHRLQDELEPIGVAVTLSARHFCMEMRGVKTSGAHTVTTKLLGEFKDNDKARSEFMANVRNY